MVQSITEWLRTVTNVATVTPRTLALRLGAIGAPLAFASGGYVRGPGSATSDSIPARLSAGEYVQPARVTSYYGVRVMEALRRLEIPREALRDFVAMPSIAINTPPIRSLESVGIPNIQRFAAGGLVSAAGAGASLPTAVSVSRDDTLHVVVEHSDDAILRVMQSTRGVKVQSENVGRFAGQFRAMLSK